MLDASRMELLQYSNWATTLKEGSLWAKNDKRPIGRPFSLSSTVESITELFFSTGFVLSLKTSALKSGSQSLGSCQ